MKIPNRLKGAFRLAVGASVVAVLLALALPLFSSTPTRYSPMLAISTVGVVTTIGFLFVTYWAATQREPAILKLDLKRDGMKLSPVAHNPTRRTLEVELSMRVRVGQRKEVPRGEFYQGADPLHLEPGGGFIGHVDLYPYFDFQAGYRGEPEPIQEEAYVSLEANWTDDQGETGTAGPRFYRLPFHSDEIVSVVSQANRDKFFAWYGERASEEAISRPTDSKHGFRQEDEDEEIIHPLRHRFREVVRRAGKREMAESVDRSVRDIWKVGGDFVEVVIQPEDIHGALRAWGDEGGSVKVQYLPDLDAPEEGIACSLYVADFETLDDPDWYQKPTKFRLVPTERNVEGFLDAILVHLRPA